LAIEKEKRFNYPKIVLAIVLTVLIWVWADLAVDETYTFTGAVIQITRPSRENLWVSFNEQSSIEVSEVTVVGPASRIADLRRQINEGTLDFRFFFDPHQEGMTEPGPYTLDVLNLLRQSDIFARQGLVIKSCEPSKVPVQVVGLQRRELDVIALDEYNNRLEADSIEPTTVEAFVPADWTGQMLNAFVRLSDREIEQSVVTPVRKRPYFQLAPGWSRTIEEEVAVRMAGERERLLPHTVTAPVVGFVMSANVQGRYEVELLNREQVLSAIRVLGSEEAKRAYENRRFQVLLEIADGDRQSQGEEIIRRDLIYNFPQDYLRQEAIELNQEPVSAQFRLVPIERPE